ncbi:MAG: ATPase, T2SS/T4P/T4SS family [archaeon]
MNPKMDRVGYSVSNLDFSKKLSDCASGQIVAKKEKRFLLLNFPQMSEKDWRLFGSILEDLKHSKSKIDKRADIYFFLKNYCLENLTLLTKEQRENLLLLLEWETIGESALTTLLKDPDFEEIVLNGTNRPIMVYHRTFGWLETNIEFTSEEKAKNVINKMAAPLGRQLTFHTPLLNAVLKDGSRINASMNPVAFSGINATIRRFKENPLTPLDIINSGVVNKEAMSFLWLAMQTSCSILVCGNTGSGKTTTLNALFCFLPRDERIIAAEETPELVLPQSHTVKMNTAEQLNIGLDKLIENTFRMRPDRVIVGEIRSPTEAKAFINTMLAGQAKGSYATFHAESASEALQRMISFGIDEKSIGSLDLIVVQKRLTRVNHEKGYRKEERKITEISEVIKNEDGKGIGLRKLFDFDYDTSSLSKAEQSERILEKMKRTFCENGKGIGKLMKEKEKLLGKLKGDISFRDFFEFAEQELGE